MQFHFQLLLRPFARAALAAALLILAACSALPFSSSDEAEGDAQAEAGESEKKKSKYEVEVKGLEDKEILKVVEASSNLVQMAKEPLSSPVGLIQRARADRERIQNVLKSFGHFAGKVKMQIAGQALDNVRPSLLRREETPKVMIEVEPGPQYTFGKVELKGLERAELRDISPDLTTGDPAKGQAVLEAEREIVARAKLAGFPYVKRTSRKMMLHHEQRTIDLFWVFEPGPLASMGPVFIEGLERTHEDFIAKMVPWKSGDQYDPRVLEEFRSDLSGMDLFSSIKLTLPDGKKHPEKYFEAPMDIGLKLKEKDARFFGFGADYSTTEGIGIEAYWGHRNLFGRGERLKVTGRVGRLVENDFDKIDKSLGLSFRKPDFLTRKQDLLFDFEILNENPDAFERDAVTSAVGIERYLTETLSFSGGVSAEYSKITDNDSEEEFLIFGFPLALRHDTTDDLLDAKRGWRNEIRVTPYTIAVGEGDSFTVTRLISRTYHRLLGNDRIVLAGRVGLGATFGSDTQEIPANKRFFAGGGGSVRGYEFQNVGPLDVDNEPVGGRSLIEVSAEIRFRYKDFGIVPFLDGGNVYDSELPKFDENLQWGAGVGFRYYSKIGPLRADLAFPLNRRENDDPVAFYISIGQAF